MKAMKNVVRAVAVVLPLATAATLATTQSGFAMSESGIQEIVVTGSENSIRARIGLPPLRDDFTVEGTPEAPVAHRPPVQHRRHDR